jgi:hypothetical protein
MFETEIRPRPPLCRSITTTPRNEKYAACRNHFSRQRVDRSSMLQPTQEASFCSPVSHFLLNTLRGRHLIQNDLWHERCSQIAGSSQKTRIDMKSKWLLAFVVASALSASAFGQIQIYIGAPPPPIRYEAPPPMPGEGFVWTAGFWEPHGPHYRWVPGRYVRAPYPGAHWTPARYEHGDKGWRMHQGYWEHKGNPHFDHDHDHGHGHDRD